MRGGLFSTGGGLFLVGGGLFPSPTVAEKSPTPARKFAILSWSSSENKLASLGATLVRNSAQRVTYLLTDRGKV